MRSAAVFGVSIALLLAAGPARAQRAPSEIDHFIRGRAPVRRGTIGARRADRISIAGRRTASVGEIADAIFREQDDFTAEARRGRAALLADPEVTDEVVELADSTILTRRTKMTVVDPDEMRRRSPEFARVNPGTRRLRVDQLTGQTRTDFDALRREAATMPAGHPLRVAADRGEQDLLDALTAGKGDFGVTTTVVVPKHPPGRDANGRIVAPAMNDGAFEPAAAAPAGRGGPTEREVSPPPPAVEESGSCHHTTKFLAGFTESDSWVWSRRWDFGVGFFRFKASAWYAYGLRIPIEIEATQTPAKIRTTSDPDVESEFEVTLSARTRNAGADFYREVGLPAADVHDGDELVLEAGFAATLTLDIVGADINVTIPGNSGFDFSQDFLPPFGDCGTNCGFEVWIPHEVTRTGIDLWAIRGSARAGVKVTGDGTVNVDYQAKAADRFVDSWQPGDKRQATKRHEISFHNGGETRRRIAGMKALKRQGSSERFGYRLSDPSYDWNVVLIPGVRADIHIDVLLFEKHIPIGPFWLESLAVRLGNVHLGPHAGTTTSAEYLHGVEDWPLTLLGEGTPSRIDAADIGRRNRRRRRTPRPRFAGRA